MLLGTTWYKWKREKHAEILYMGTYRPHAHWLMHKCAAEVTESGNKINANQNTHEHSSCSVTLLPFPFLPRSLPLLTFPPNNAASPIAAALLSRFSEMTIRMNVRMEHFSSGWCPVLKENLPPAASDMQWSVSGWRAVCNNGNACEVQKHGWDEMWDNLRRVKSSV